jgi:hypothetical protein
MSSVENRTKRDEMQLALLANDRNTLVNMRRENDHSTLVNVRWENDHSTLVNVHRANDHTYVRSCTLGVHLTRQVRLTA